MDADIFIAGGGPVGMTLALELAHHGVRSVLVERNPTTTRHPKMDLTNGRSMELFRRLKIADDLRAVGVPPSEPLDIVWATKATGHVLHRFAYPSPDGARDRARVANDGSHTLEPGMRVSQIILEPVLKAKIDASPLVDVRFGWAFESFEQDADGVSITIRNSESGAAEIVRTRYLAGCDGGGSKVREQAGIALEGQFAIAGAYMIHFRSTAYDVLARFGIAYHLQTGLGTIIAQNGKDIWTLQSIAPAETKPDDLLRQFVGQDFDYEILVSNPWTPHMVLAERYRDGRVFLAGDAAHQVIPTGGYGMNTGVGDAVDLGWKLAAVVNGWGGEALLDSYEWERHKIGAQNRAQAMQHMLVRVAITEAIMEAQAEGDLDALGAAPRRVALGKKIAALGNAENECWGIEHGYSYAGSAVICAEDGDEEAFDPLVCKASTAPGNRFPNYYLADGTAILDLLGPELTLLAIGDVDTSAARSAAQRLGMPLSIVELEEEPIFERLHSNLILVRPDQHIAWRDTGETGISWAAVLACVSGQQLAIAEAAL